MDMTISDRITMAAKQHKGAVAPTVPGLWARTLIMGSHDDVEQDANGISHFVKKIKTGVDSCGKALFKTEPGKVEWKRHNMVPISGCQYAMEKIFEIPGTQLSFGSLYATDRIGVGDTTSNANFTLPGNVTQKEPYRVGHRVQLFGVGITGTGESELNSYAVGYRETGISMSITGSKGETIDGTMIPFRYTNQSLATAEVKQYFGKKLYTDDGSRTAYYLKRFENEAAIKHIWKSDDPYAETETLVGQAAITNGSSMETPIESFVECVLKISKRDVKEWFTDRLADPDRARINTIALYSGLYNGASDFSDVRLFSKLVIPTEYLSISKDLNIIYRVYTS